MIPHPPVYCQSMYTHVLLNQNKFSLSKSQMLTHINAYIWLIISKFHTCALHCYKSTSVCTINLCKLRRGVPSYAYLAVVVCQFKKRSCQCIFVVVSTKLLHSTACHVMYTILICVCFVYYNVDLLICVYHYFILSYINMCMFLFICRLVSICVCHYFILGSDRW